MSSIAEPYEQNAGCQVTIRVGHSLKHLCVLFLLYCAASESVSWPQRDGETVREKDFL